MARILLAAALVVALCAAPHPGRAEGSQPRKQDGAQHKQSRGVECMTRPRAGAPAPVTASVSAYSAAETGGARTASGRRPKPGIVAVSPDLYKAGWTFGREVCVSGHGIFVVGDLMGPGRAKAVDIFMDTRTKALRFGRRTLQVRLLPLEPDGAPAAPKAAAKAAAPGPAAPTAPALVP
jgi:3D (Asp-Asp-Asp) domain-containing protein